MLRLLAICLALILPAVAWAQSGYRIQPGDQLSIEVIEDPSLNREVLVLPDGSVSFPLVGVLRASGRTTDRFRQELATALAPNFATEPSVFVSVAALAEPDEDEDEPITIDVYVIGEVETPGLIEVEPGTTLLQALSQSGGFSDFAATKRIQLRRVDPHTGDYVAYRFNYRAVEDGARISGRTRLIDGDVIVVPQRRLFE